MEQPESQVPLPHVVFLPFPSYGHIKPVLELAELISHAGFQVTFLNTQALHDSLLLTFDMPAFRRCYPEFEFLPIPDPVHPPSHVRPPPGRASGLYDKTLSLAAVIKPALRDLLTSINPRKGHRRPATCIIADGLLCSSVIDVSEEFRIPFFALRTSSACCIWTYFHLKRLIEAGDVPCQDEDMDKLVTCIPGLENVVRRRDLPGIFRIERSNDPGLESFLNDQTSVLPRASALILHTFDELEGPMVTELGPRFTKVYTVGPLHALSNVRSNEPTPLASSKSISSKEDRSCLNWLDSQSSNSVIFVSFGTILSLRPDQIFEFWHGLVNSGKPFLWVIRSDSITAEGDSTLMLRKLKDMTEDKGLIVNWAPQEEVLSHPAIGGFLTHSGWNSTLESVYAGVPMICWPVFGDQQINSRFVSHVWKLGVDMKDTCDRSSVEKAVRDLMEDRREEIMKSVNEMKKLAHETVKEGGTSFCNLGKLIGDIRLMSQRKTHCQ